MTGNPVTGSNPYIGARSFEEGEQQLFHGRDEEESILEGLVMSRRAVVLFAQSGAGKSSLIKAGLVPALKRVDMVGQGRFRRPFQKMRVLPVLKVGGAIPAELKTQIANVYVFSALYTLCAGCTAERIAGMSLVEGLNYYSQHAPGGPAPQAEADIEGTTQFINDGEDGAEENDLLLVFDQFEELFTHHAAHWQQREDFFRQVNQALEAIPCLHVLFSMREDYLAELTPYAPLLPEQLRPRFRLERLKREAALQAVVEPASRCGRTFAEGVAEHLVDNLRRSQPGREHASRGGSETVEGEYVEPVHLQLVCQQLWNKIELNKPEQTVIVDGDVDDFGDVDRALTDFYESALKQVLADPDISERMVRDWFDSMLITPAATRGLVYRGDTDTEGLPNDAVAVLTSAYIIRPVVRGRDTWYELAHDRLVEPILAANHTWLAGYQNPLIGPARAWIDSGRDPSKLLRGKAFKEADLFAGQHKLEVFDEEVEFLEASRQAERARQNTPLFRARDWAAKDRDETLLLNPSQLPAAEKYAADNPSELTEDELEYLGESRRAVRRAQRRRQLVALYTTGAIIALSLLSAWALLERSSAERSLSTAVAAESTAQADRATALSSQADAQFAAAQAMTAEAAAKTAEAKARFAEATAQRNEADARIAESIAKHSQKIAEAGQLATKGRALMGTDLRLAAQLAVESYALEPTWENSSLLLDLVLTTVIKTIEPYREPVKADGTIFGAALSPDGAHLAWGTRTGEVILWDYRENRRVWTRHMPSGSTRSVAFSPDGQWLAAGGGMPYLLIWDVAAGSEVARLEKDQGVVDQVLSLAFHPTKPLLAAAVYNRIVLIDTTSWQKTHRSGFEPAAIRALAWSPEGDLLASGEEQLGYGVMIWDPADLRLPIFSYASEIGAMSLAWSPDGRYLASGHSDSRGSMQVRDSQTWERVKTGIPDAGSELWGVAFSPDGKALVRAGKDQVITVYDASSFEKIGIFDNRGVGNYTSLEFLPASGFNLLLAVTESAKDGYFASSLYVIGLDHPLVSQQWQGSGAVRAVAGSGGGSLLLARTSGAQTSILSSPGNLAAQMPLESVLYKPAGTYHAVAVSPRGDRVALWPASGALEIRALPSGELIHTIPSGDVIGTSLAFSPDGATLAGASCADTSAPVFCDRPAVQLWNVESGKLLPPVHLQGLQSQISALALSPDGALLALGLSDGSVQLWNRAANRAEGLPLSYHRQSITSLAFSPDSLRLASGSRDNTLLLWDLSARQPVGSPLTAASQGVSALFFQDGDHLLAGYQDGKFLQWDLRVERWKQIVCGLAGKSLSAAEQSQYFPGNTYRNTCAQP